MNSNRKEFSTEACGSLSIRISNTGSPAVVTLPLGPYHYDIASVVDSDALGRAKDRINTILSTQASRFICGGGLVSREYGAVSATCFNSETCVVKIGERRHRVKKERLITIRHDLLFLINNPSFYRL